MSDDRVWLRHKDHDGAWLAPAGVVDAWAEMGWVPGDPPEEHNPVTAEMLAAQQAAAEQQAAPTTKASRKSGTDTTSQE